MASSYEKALDYIHGLYRFGSRLGLARPRRLLAALGDPHLGLRVVHVAGTNGKGSVAAMVASILRAAGYRTGLYISPYVVDFRERISVDGEHIAPDEVAELTFGALAPAAERLAAKHGEDGQVTEFEFVTALGLLHFARRAVDYLVCEVGLGGRFDATNVIDRPLVSVITPVGLDHTDRLGPTLADIAAEKAGIIKRSAPVVSGPQDPEALQVIAAAARQRACPLYLAGADRARPGAPAGTPGRLLSGRAVLRKASLQGQVIDFTGPGGVQERGLRLPLLGPHQVANAATALTAVCVLREWGHAPDVGSGALREGLARTVWPGRFEVFGEDPPVVVDGAHNPPGARALAETLRELLPGRRLVMVLGLLADKDAPAFLAELLPPALPEVGRVVCCRPDNPRAVPAAELAALVSRRCPGLPVEKADSPGAALDLAYSRAGPGGAVCVAGSLYQVQEAREAAARLTAGGTGEAGVEPSTECGEGAGP